MLLFYLAHRINVYHNAHIGPAFLHFIISIDKALLLPLFQQFPNCFTIPDEVFAEFRPFDPAVPVQRVIKDLVFPELSVFRKRKTGPGTV